MVSPADLASSGAHRLPKRQQIDRSRFMFLPPILSGNALTEAGVPRQPAVSVLARFREPCEQPLDIRKRNEWLVYVLLAGL
jgi:hypothetical protein